MDISNPEAGIEVKNGLPCANSENLVDFLSGVKSGGEIISDVDRDDFSSELRLPWLKKYVDEMYGAQKISGEYLPKEIKDKLERNAQRLQKSDDVGVQLLANVYQKAAEEKGVLEESRVVFLDPKTKSIQATEINWGSGVSVKNRTLETYKKGLPLLSSHSHPVSELPTARDYEDMILVFKDGKRVI